MPSPHRPSTFAAYTVGICFTSVAKSGLDLLSDIIVGDLTPLEWRGFFGAARSVPFVLTVPVNGFIAEGFAVNGHIAAAALAMAAVPLVATLFMPDFYLGKQQNAVTNVGGWMGRGSRSLSGRRRSRAIRGILGRSIAGALLLITGPRALEQDHLPFSGYHLP